MNVEIGPEAALFPEKEYINGIAVAVRDGKGTTLTVGCIFFTIHWTLCVLLYLS